jgi:hypothetical protein
MQDILSTVELDPVALVDGIVSPISRVADVELEEEAAI